MLKPYLTAAIVAGSLALSPTVAAQNQSQPACETDPAFRAFDFWIGHWDVTDRSTGKKAGTNIIRAIEGGCAITEHWTNIAGGTGQSLNYYNSITQKWRQIWVSAGGGGYSIDYSGGFSKGSMTMEGTLYGYNNGTSAPFRGTWTPNDDGSVRQLFEQYDETEKTWKVWFDGLYVKKK